MRRFGVLIASLALSSLSGCWSSIARSAAERYSMAIVTFDNQTSTPEIPKSSDQMRKELQRRSACAMLQDAPTPGDGVISAYDADVPVGFSANPQQAVSARRRLQLTIEIEIVDQSNGHVIYANKALREEADYAERAEQEGRTAAIAKIVQKIIEGVQSNW